MKLTSEVIIPPAAATTLRDSERNLILHTLEAVGWVIVGRKGAASRLGLKRTTLIHKMKKLGISRTRPENSENVLEAVLQGPDSLAQM